MRGQKSEGDMPLSRDAGRGRGEPFVAKGSPVQGEAADVLGVRKPGEGGGFSRGRSGGDGGGENGSGNTSLITVLRNAQNAEPKDLAQAAKWAADYIDVVSVLWDARRYLELVPTGVPKITHVAVRWGDKVFAAPKPNRHHDILHPLVKTLGHDYEEGFLNDRGEFLNRKNALLLATESGQLNRRQGAQFYQGPELYSEDLW